MVVIQVANTGSFMTAVPRGVMQVADNIETKNFLDKPRQPPYHGSEAILFNFAISAAD
ncbi:MAG: hypothetical protein ACEY3H_04785 [Wolbachia sp.]